MRNRLPMPWKTLALALGLLAPAAARAEILLVETADVIPTSVVSLPRTYYVPTTFTSSSVVMPTSYATAYDLSPTSYYAPASTILPTRYYVPARYYATSYIAPTAYVAPTSYVETGYTTYRRGLFGRRRYVETSYLYEPSWAVTPTYYVAPRSYVASAAVVASSACCETASPAVVQAAPIRESRPVAEPMPERQAGGTIESSAVGEPEDRIEPIVPSVAQPRKQTVVPNGTTGGQGAGAGATSSGTGATSNPGGATVPSTPAPAAAVPTTRDTRPAPAAQPTPAAADAAKAATNPQTKTADGPTPPARTEPEPPNFAPAPVPAPAGPSNPLDFPNMDDATRRSSYKPVAPSFSTRLAQNVLRGRVVSADSRLPESGVEVILVDRMGRFENRRARTDASGRFALVVPEGDWTILLTMPSGRALPVEEGVVTASAGKVSDRWGRELTNLILSR